MPYPSAPVGARLEVRACRLFAGPPRLEAMTVMWWGHGAWGAGDWVTMILMMMVFWGLIAALIVWAIQGRRTNSNVAPIQRPTADEVLARRFARGEINADEYARGRAVLHPAGRQS